MRTWGRRGTETGGWLAAGLAAGVGVGVGSEAIDSREIAGILLLIVEVWGEPLP